MHQERLKYPVYMLLVCEDCLLIKLLTAIARLKEQTFWKYLKLKLNGLMKFGLSINFATELL